MAISKIKTGSITDSAITEAKLGPGSVAEAKIGPGAVTVNKIGSDAVTSAKISDGTIVNADINACAAIASGKLSVCTAVLEQNISLLGFKMAVNEGLTVFNLVDGIVDEFHDESGTDESEGSNDTYCASSDFYQNTVNTPVSISAGFSATAITEPDTSAAGTNPTFGSGTFGTFTVPCGMTSANLHVWGSGGGNGAQYQQPSSAGAGGGFTSGTLAVTASQVLYAGVGEGGSPCSASTGGTRAFLGGGAYNSPIGAGGGGGLSGVFNSTAPNYVAPQPAPGTTPGIYMIAGSGAGSSAQTSAGGAGGGLTGQAGNAGGGSQTAGGSGVSEGQTGGFLFGGNAHSNANGGGGSGFYGGGGSGNHTSSAGGGSSYYGHPQITSGATEGGDRNEGGGLASPLYVASTNEGAPGFDSFGEDGYVFVTASYCQSVGGQSTTIVSTAFAAGSVPSTSRIVVFEENVQTPTLNTDIIASISRDGGSTYTTATLSDSGYVTGSSGQRILTGQATISGQPSGQSMRWKLALANNSVKIHGVSLQWA
tara:strand:+ start:207 stop:1817 length:1611 start_codon:yes stop_codon:yes gene_type:complete